MMLDGMYDDAEYLMTMNERDSPLIMFPCRLRKTVGTALADLGSTNTYSSWKQGKPPGLPFQTTARGVVKLPNGHMLGKFGTVEFNLYISDWHGTVRASVTQLALVDFDIALGMDWRKKWRSQTD